MGGLPPPADKADSLALCGSYSRGPAAGAEKGLALSAAGSARRSDRRPARVSSIGSTGQVAHRASVLNLLTAAIVLSNTGYLQRAVQAVRTHGQPVDEALLAYLSPLGCEQISLTGDNSWRSKRTPGQFQPLDPF